MQSVELGGVARSYQFLFAAIPFSFLRRCLCDLSRISCKELRVVLRSVFYFILFFLYERDSAEQKKAWFFSALLNLCVFFVSYQSQCRICGKSTRDSRVLVVHEIAIISMMMSFNLSTRLHNLYSYVGVCNQLHLNTLYIILLTFHFYTGALCKKSAFFASYRSVTA